MKFNRKSWECLSLELSSLVQVLTPVLLVKKKDGTRRLYVDYRALNFTTLKDRFPVPIVDELLDELQGSCYYSKIDLKCGYH